MGETETASSKCLSQLSSGACPLDLSSKPADMPLPIIPEDPNGRYRPTPEFVEGMIKSFKNGGKIPKRIAWEIVLGCKEVVERERSLVEVVVPEGVHCDVVGDSECLITRESCDLADEMKRME